jgi:PilZ domain
MDDQAIDERATPCTPAGAGRPSALRAGADRRRQRRRRPKATTNVQCYGNGLGLGRNIAHSLLDVSETGVRLLLVRMVAAGREVEVNLDGQAGAAVRRVARVVWAVPAEGGLFCTGCEFLKPVPYSAVADLAGR